MGMTPDAAAPRPADRVEEIRRQHAPSRDEKGDCSVCIVLAELAAREAALATKDQAFGFIESAALFHPDQAWPDELKAQLRRIGKLAHEALTPVAHAAPTRDGGKR